MTENTFPNLGGYTGSRRRYRHSLNYKVGYTDGVKYVAETAEAYWLIDTIALLQEYDRAVKSEPFQVWILKVTDKGGAILSCDDGNKNVVYTKSIASTDFPKQGIKFYFVRDTLMLPTEY